MCVAIKKQMIKFFTNRFDRGIICSDMREDVDRLYELYICALYYEFATTKAEFVDFAISIGMKVDNDNFIMHDQDLCESRLSRSPKTKPIFDENTEFESLKAVSYKIITCALAAKYASDKDDFVKWVLNPHEVMRYLNDNGYKKKFNSKKYFNSTDTLVLSTIKKYLINWGFTETRSRANDVAKGTICVCTDEQYEVFTEFLEYVDQNVSY